MEGKGRSNTAQILQCGPYLMDTECQVRFVQDPIMGHANVEYVSANQNGKMMIVTVQTLLTTVFILLMLVKRSSMVKMKRFVREMDSVNAIIASALNPQIHQYNMVDLIVNSESTIVAIKSLLPGL